MPRLPTASDLSAVNPGASRSFVNMQVADIAGATNAVARGVADAGQGVSTFAAERKKKFAAQERFNTKIGLLRAEEAYADRVKDLDPLDPEYVEKKKAARREIFAPVLSSVKDPDNKMDFDLATEADYVELGIRAEAEQRQALGKKAELDIDTYVESQRRRIRDGADPQVVLAETAQTIQDNQFIDTLTKDEATRKASTMLTADAVEANAVKSFGTLSGGAVVRAVIHAESSGKPGATSPKGALGLMQVMPETAAEIAAELGDAEFLKMSPADRKEYLKRPDVSVRYGSYYLDKQLKRYNGDLEAALIAYNAGPGRADAWLKAGRNYDALPPGVRAETQPYVDKIFGTLGVTAETAKYDPRYVASKEDVAAGMEHDPLFRTLPVGEADKVKASVLSQVTQRETQDKAVQEAQKVQLKSAIANDLATVAAGGQPSKDLTYDDIAATLGADDAERWRTGVADASEQAQVTSDFKSMTNDQINGRVADYEAIVEKSKGTPVYARRLAILEKVKKQQDDEITYRRKNPNEAALRYDFVQQAAQDYVQAVGTPTQNPNQDRNAVVTEAFGNYMKATTEAQVSFGIPRQGVAIVDDTTASKIAGYFLDLPADLTTKQDNTVARDTLSRVYEQLRNTFGDYTDEVIAYSLAKTKPLSKETSVTMVGLLSSLAKGKDIRRSTVDTTQRLQDADSSDPGLMGFFDWFNSDEKNPDVPLGSSADENMNIEDTAGAR